MRLRPGAWLGSIRNRIILGYVALLAVALVIIVVVVGGALSARLDRDIDRRLAAEVEQLELVIEEGDPDTGERFVDAEVLFDTHLRRVLPADDDAFFTLVDGDGFLVSFDPPARLLGDSELVADFAAVDSSTFRTIDTEAGTARVLIVPLQLEQNDGTFIAAAFTDADRRELRDLFRLVVIVGGVVLVITALVAAAVADRVSRRIRSFTEVSRSITDEDLSARIPEDPSADRELNELTQTFNAMMARLEGGFASQRRFLDDAAHEFRTPLTIVQGHLDVLGDDPAEIEETVALLTDEVDRLNRYVDDLLVLAQAEQPDFLRPQPVDLGPFLDGLFAKVERLDRRRWVIDRRADGSWPLDEQRITQAVLNLAQNAVRHTAENDEIGLGVSIDDGTVRIAVRDTGAGIDPDVADDLFRRHVRSARSRTEGGVGLGLSIVDAVATAHGGRVIVESQPGHGATFTIEIRNETS